jgi:hypothetical protein
MNDGTLKVTPITDKQPQAVAKFSITCLLEGFPVSVEVEGKADALRAMIDRLKAIGATPPVGTMVPNADSSSDAPICEFHGKMKKGNYGWFCPKKMGDGSFCKSRG